MRISMSVTDLLIALGGAFVFGAVVARFAKWRADREHHHRERNES